jgi:hypothetical protein
MQIDEGDKHLSNPDSPKIASLEPRLNVKSESPLHEAEQDLASASRDERMQID